MNDKEDRPYSILIADDHQIFLDGLKALLKKEKHLQLTGEVCNGRVALDMIIKNQPDLLITDINMPGLTGVELTREVKSRFPEVKVLVLSMFNDRDIVSDILMSEAEGYILKNAGKQELINAINRILDNSTYYCNEVTNIMLSRVRKQKMIEKNTATLTPREIEIIKLIMEEYSSEEIAGKLFISKRTVDTHRKNIIHKTNTRTLVGLIMFAIENNLVEIHQ